jgi:RND family efflux transporter MFP subunit
VASACNRGGAEQAAANAAEPVVSLGPENVTRVQPRTLESGPLVSGTLEARRVANARAEVGGSILEMNVEQGQSVKKGQVLARIDDASLRDQALAARSAARVARSALEVAKAEEARNRKLARAGVITRRDFERAQLARAQAEGQLADAQARLTLAQEQAGRTRVTAPMDGVVSERQANAGDIVQPGAPLFTIVDPSSMRLEASVPAEFLGQLQPRTRVDFRVTGYGDRAFTGLIERINPVVDPSTGQVRIYVTIPNSEQALMAGLFAQGRVASQRREALAVPIGAVDLSGASPEVRVARGERVARVPVELGLRDDVAQMVEVRSGLQAGDVVLLGSARELAENTRVQFPAPREEAPAVGGGGREGEPQQPPVQQPPAQQPPVQQPR